MPDDEYTVAAKVVLSLTFIAVCTALTCWLVYA